MDTGLLGANISSLAIKIVLLSKIRAMVYQKTLYCLKRKKKKKVSRTIHRLEQYELMNILTSLEALVEC